MTDDPLKTFIACLVVIAIFVGIGLLKRRR